MDHLLERLDTLEHHVRTLQQQNSSDLGRLRWWRRLACSLAVLTVFSLPLSLGAGPNDRKSDDRKGGNVQHHKPKDDDEKLAKGLAQRVRALERKLEHVTSEVGEGGLPELVITGANVRIVNGLGGTQTTNALGNLILGYNEARHPLDGPDVRTGSHVLVVGREHNYTTFGGIAVGRLNEISGNFASAIGAGNVASGIESSVTGGIGNTASGISSSVIGGAANTASGDLSTVSGGVFNTAGGTNTSISGGGQNTTSGTGSSISGGNGNTASGLNSAVSGGLGNVSSGFVSVVSGGSGNTASGGASVVGGGLQRTASGETNWAAGSLFQEQ